MRVYVKKWFSLLEERSTIVLTTNLPGGVNAALSHGRDTLHVCGRRGRMSRGKTKERERERGVQGPAEALH